MRKFQLVLIKPSHYDDDGYVIRWWRAMIPSNSLAARLRHCRRLRRAAGARSRRRHRHRRRSTRPTRASTFRQLLARFARNGNFGLVALVGVQSNQYPRALDIARPFRAAGIPVAIGGFHVSGCLSMLDGAGRRSRRVPRHGHRHVRRRGRRPARRGAARRRRRDARSRSTTS